MNRSGGGSQINSRFTPTRIHTAKTSLSFFYGRVGPRFFRRMENFSCRTINHQYDVTLLQQFTRRCAIHIKRSITPGVMIVIVAQGKFCEYSFLQRQYIRRCCACAFAHLDNPVLAVCILRSWIVLVQRFHKPILISLGFTTIIIHISLLRYDRPSHNPHFVMESSARRFDSV